MILNFFHLFLSITSQPGFSKKQAVPSPFLPPNLIPTQGTCLLCGICLQGLLYGKALYLPNCTFIFTVTELFTESSTVKTVTHSIFPSECSL